MLLVAREGVTKFQAAQRALAELKSCKILGFVLNAVVNPPTSEGYYGYDAPEEPTPAPLAPEKESVGPIAR